MLWNNIRRSRLRRLSLNRTWNFKTQVFCEDLGITPTVVIRESVEKIDEELTAGLRVVTHDAEAGLLLQ